MQRIILARRFSRLFPRSRSTVARAFCPGPQNSLSSRCNMQKGNEGPSGASDADNQLFHYTSGRWLYNEHLRLAERRLHFNINELLLVIAKSVGLSRTEIIHFSKIAEGGSYRIFEATFRDGLKVIARLPYPSTIPLEYGVASEAATLEFLRLHGIPTPQVLDWSSSASNPVGAEYIIMERMRGEELEKTWYTMTLKERMAIMEQIVQIESHLMKIKFPASGSIFFKSSLGPEERVDMPQKDSIIDVSRFCIGPSTEYLWWHQERGRLALSHGPWTSTEALMEAVGQREALWLKSFGKLRYPREPLYREFYDHQKVDPKLQISRLTDYLRIVPYLAPQEDALNKPTLRHPDFSPTNIFISDSGDITGIIDWQHTTILPIFLQANVPKHFQNYGDDDSENFRAPKLPPGFDNLADSDKEREMELYRRRQVHYFYVGFTNRLNPAHFHAMGKHNLVLRHQLYDIAGKPWEGDNTSLQAGLINILAHWSEITSQDGENVAPPLQFSSTETKKCLDRDAKQKKADLQMQQLRDFIGVNIDGWVPTSEFETAREKSQYVKKQMLEAAETEKERIELEKYWPFQDHEEID